MMYNVKDFSALLFIPHAECPVMASVEETRVVVKDVHDVVDNTNQKVSAIQHQMASAQRDLKDIKDKVGTRK